MSRPPHPSTPGGVCYLLVVAGVVFGLVVAVAGPWRGGVSIVGLSFAFALLVRLVLPDRLAGMLAVRGRLLDVLVLAFCSAALLTLAVVVPQGT